MGLAITAATSPSVDAQFFWRYTAFATIAYVISRGLAKSGTRSRAHDPREDLRRTTGATDQVLWKPARMSKPPTPWTGVTLAERSHFASTRPFTGHSPANPAEVQVLSSASTAGPGPQ
jgi:hypothetical protein